MKYQNMNIVPEIGYNKALARLTQDEQYAVSCTVNEIRFGRFTKGLNEEKLRISPTENLMSYRVNDDLRILAYKWKPTDLLLLDVGHHQEIYRRAARLKLRDNGSSKLPAFFEEEVVAVQQRKIFTPVQKTWQGFASVDKKKLEDMGLSSTDVNELTGITSEDELLSFIEKRSLDYDLSKALIEVGDDPSSVNQLLNELRRESAKQIIEVNKDSYSRSRYFVLTPEFENMLYAGKLENWQVYLHPTQLRAVEMDAAGPMMVKGPAGTGKTVVAVHRVKWLLNRFKGRILFTTFTRTLAADASRMLGVILDGESIKRVDVKTFDALLKEFWSEYGGGGTIVYDSEDVEEPPFHDDILRIAKDLQYKGNRTIDFIGKEFERIVLEHNVQTLDEYQRIQRPKLYGLVQAKEREVLWGIFSKLLPVVSIKNRRPRVAAINRITGILRQLYTLSHPYAAVVVDEVQDFGASEFRMLAALTGNSNERIQPNSLFLAGDGHQRIYGRSGTLKNCGINIVNRSILLKQCYRSSQKIREYAENVIKGIVVSGADGEEDALMGGESLCEGEVPAEEFFNRKNYDALNDCIAKTIAAWMRTGSKRYSDYAVLMRQRGFPGRPECYLYNSAKALTARNIPAVAFTKKGAIHDENAVRVMTMHSAKGLQFYGVVVVLDHWPYRPDQTADAEACVAQLEQEKCLLYMSLMRATSRVLVTGCMGRPSELGFYDAKAVQMELALQKAVVEAQDSKEPSWKFITEDGRELDANSVMSRKDQQKLLMESNLGRLNYSPIELNEYLFKHTKGLSRPLEARNFFRELKSRTAVKKQ